MDNFLIKVNVIKLDFVFIYILLIINKIMYITIYIYTISLETLNLDVNNTVHFIVSKTVTCSLIDKSNSAHRIVRNEQVFKIGKETPVNLYTFSRSLKPKTRVPFSHN